MVNFLFASSWLYLYRKLVEQQSLALATALELLSVLGEDGVAVDENDSLLVEDLTALEEDSFALEQGSVALDCVDASLEIASELLSMSSTLLEDSSDESGTLELLSSPHAEIKIADNSKMPELRNVLLEIVFIKNSCVQNV